MPRRSARIAALNSSEQTNIPVPDIVSAPSRANVRASPPVPEPIPVVPIAPVAPVAPVIPATRSRRGRPLNATPAAAASPVVPIAPVAPVIPVTRSRRGRPPGASSTSMFVPLLPNWSSSSSSSSPPPIVPARPIASVPRGRQPKSKPAKKTNSSIKLDDIEIDTDLTEEERFRYPQSVIYQSFDQEKFKNLEKNQLCHG
jgi:hypothetical protein